MAYFLFLRFAARIAGRLFTVHDRAQSGRRMQRTKTGGAYDWDLDYPSPSMLRVYVFLVDWRVAVASDNTTCVGVQAQGADAKDKDRGGV